MRFNKLYSLPLFARILYSVVLHIIFFVIIIAGFPEADRKSDVENVTVIDLVDISEITNLPTKTQPIKQQEVVEETSIKPEPVMTPEEQKEEPEKEPEPVQGPIIEPDLKQEEKIVEDKPEPEEKKAEQPVAQNNEPEAEHDIADENEMIENQKQEEQVEEAPPLKQEEPQEVEAEEVIEKIPEIVKEDIKKEIEPPQSVAKPEKVIEAPKKVIETKEIKQPIEKKEIKKPVPTPAKPAPKKQPVPKKQAVKKDSLDDKFEELERLIESDNKKVFQKDMALSLSEIDSIRNQIRNAWNPIAFSGSGKVMKVTLLLYLDKQGNVISVKTILNNNSNASYSVFVESVVRAAHKASPIKNLLPEKFQSWKEMKINFTSEDLAKLLN